MMIRIMKMRSLTGLACGSALAAAAIVAAAAGRVSLGDEPAADPLLTRTREQVKMLDELYKTAVVSVTNRYEGPPAIRMAKDVFAAMEKRGWHKAKLIDVTGAPQNEANVPATDFEKRAAEAIRAGKPYYDEVAGTAADRTLYVATVVPTVTKKCATCHGVKTGDLLGFVRYEVPIK